MAPTSGLDDDSSGKLVGTHVLDPKGNVTLVFNSKDTVVSGPLELTLKTAEYRNGENTQLMNKKRKRGFTAGLEDIEVQISSKYLVLAPYFEALLSDKFQEGTKLQKDGSVRVPLPDDSAPGMLILLDTLHHKVTTVTPSLLAQIAQLADKYNMSTVTVNSHIKWGEDVKGQIPMQWEPRVVDWLAISHVLEWRSLEEKMMNIALMSITKDMPYKGSLPINNLLAALQLRRAAILQDAFDMLSNTINGYLARPGILCPRGRTTCAYKCIGEMLVKLNRARLYPASKELPADLRITDYSRRLGEIDFGSDEYCDGVKMRISHIRADDDMKKITRFLQESTFNVEKKN